MRLLLVWISAVFGKCEKSYLSHRILISILANWESWQPWRPCSQTCGSGTRARFRNCDTSGGLGATNCDWTAPVSFQESGSCNDGPCPSWSNWSSWSDCSALCGNGIRSRNRECDTGNESDCAGSTTEDEVCQGSYTPLPNPGRLRK